MGFPGTWMTESESVIYRVVPKCACSTIGQIMFYSDHGEFFDGDIHDATHGMHKWALESSQPLISANVAGHKSYAFTCVRNPYPRLVSLYRMIADVDGVWRLRRRMGLGQTRFSQWLHETQPFGTGGGGRRHQRWRRYGTYSAQAWTTNTDGERLVTDILRLEHLADELPALLADLNLPLRAELSHVNARIKTDWRAWYSPQTSALVANRYAWDLRRFNYS